MELKQHDQFIPDNEIGLTTQQVDQRIAQGKDNVSKKNSSRSFWDIFRANIFTRFNAIMLILVLAVIAVNGGFLNTTFFWIMVINSGIGIFQEIRAKRSLDKLSILSQAQSTVLRDGKTKKIPLTEVVEDDLIILNLGDQVVADGQIIEGHGLEVDESLLTGEAEQIPKIVGDEILSGSSVVAGKGIMVARKVGDASYSAQIASESKKFQRVNSELMNGINQILRWISYLLIIVAPILIIGQFRHSNNVQTAVTRSVAAIVGMIPEGLVMLTSVAFMVAVIRLASKKVLVQSLPSVEILARVDTLLLDKTGTLTKGTIHFEELLIEESQKSDEQEVKQILVTLSKLSESPTNDAIISGMGEAKEIQIVDSIPFSSAKKWSGIQTKNSSYLLGAPEVLLKDEKLSAFKKKVEQVASSGNRVLVLLSAGQLPKENTLKQALVPVAIVVLGEEIKEDAKTTLGYFADQNVDIKIISGDSPLTVGAIARKAGLHSEEFDVKALDAQELPDPVNSPKAFIEAIHSYNVFGRVKPEQKRQIVAALQEEKHVVAMTGDGVNDALALKKADLGIAMQSGSDATKAVAEVVLMDNNFSHLPNVLSEGRRVIANIVRVSNLFLIKNIYSLILALGVTVFGLSYPYLPIQMTVINFLSIGLPAFLFALAPNNQIYRPGFLKRIAAFSLPIGVVGALAMLIDYAWIQSTDQPIIVDGTSVSIVTMMISIAVLIVLSRPFMLWKGLLIAFSSITFIALLLIPASSNALSYQLNVNVMPITLFVGLIGFIFVLLISRIPRRMAEKSNPENEI